jgi:hypothetical protein
MLLKTSVVQESRKQQAASKAVNSSSPRAAWRDPFRGDRLGCLLSLRFMMTFFSDLHDRWAHDRASFLICWSHGMLIGVVALSFDAGRMPSPLCVMEGRNEI